MTADGEPIEWCRGHNGLGFDFWVMAPTVVSGDTVHVEAAKEWLPTQTYFIAVPDGRLDKELDLCGKTISFDATGVWMAKSHSTSSPYKGLYVQNDTTIPGDVDNDGILSIIDVVKTVDAILGVHDLSLPIAIGDMNSDNILDIIDLIMIINRILGL